MKRNPNLGYIDHIDGDPFNNDLANLRVVTRSENSSWSHVIKFYYEILGGHTHISIYAGRAGSASLGKCGDIIMTNEEFAAFWESHAELGFEEKVERG